jgi:spore coat polysaccharide biosynthesis protein SpsF
LDSPVDYGSLRWTVDTPADLEFVRQVYSRLGGRPNFTWLDVLALLEREPELSRINAGEKHRTMFDVDERYRQQQKTKTNRSRPG